MVLSCSEFSLRLCVVIQNTLQLFPNSSDALRVDVDVKLVLDIFEWHISQLAFKMVNQGLVVQQHRFF